MICTAVQGISYVKQQFLPIFVYVGSVCYCFHSWSLLLSFKLCEQFVVNCCSLFISLKLSDCWRFSMLSMRTVMWGIRWNDCILSLSWKV